MPIMRWRPVLLCLLLVSATALADAAPPLSRSIAQQLATHPAVRAEFVQSQLDPALASPQTSSGELLYLSNQGMIWKTLLPFQQTLVLSASHAMRIDGDGSRHALQGHGRGPRQILGLLDGLLGPDSGALDQQFQIQAEGTPSHWQLILTPRRREIARVLSTITLAGGDYLQQIQIQRPQASRTIIELRHARDAGPLRSEERSELDLSPP